MSEEKKQTKKQENEEEIVLNEGENNIEISEDIKIIKFNPEKNESDTELALKYALDLMPNNIFLFSPRSVFSIST